MIAALISSELPPTPDTVDLSQLIIPGLEILGLLFLLWIFVIVRADFRPITRNIITGLASKAQTNAALFALALALAFQSSLTTLADLAQQYGWAHTAGWCKVIGAFLGTLIAFAVRQGVGAPAPAPAPGTSSTASPFPPAKPSGT